MAQLGHHGFGLFQLILVLCDALGFFLAAKNKEKKKNSLGHEYSTPNADMAENPFIILIPDTTARIEAKIQRFINILSRDSFSRSSVLLNFPSTA